MHIQYSKISSHSQWQSLKEVWIGGVYPDNFFDHYPANIQDIFCRINELTREDFKVLRNTLEKLGVSVVEPQFNRVDDYLDDEGRLGKPPISPCDFSLTLNDTLYVLPQYHSGIDPYQHAIDQYRSNGQKVEIIDRAQDPMAWVEFPCVVRAGKDIILDYDPSVTERKVNAHLFAEKLAPNYRVHLSTTGDHQDGIFFPFKPGHIISSHYQQTYQQSFPNWDVFFLKDVVPNFHKLYNSGVGQRWWLPGVDYATYNEQLLSISKDWIGMPEETVFDVNNLAIDEKTIIVSALNDDTAKYLDSIGVDAHISDFKTKYYWDAGIHCCTSDIYRVGDCEDYWPDRGSNGVYLIDEWI